MEVKNCLCYFVRPHMDWKSTKKYFYFSEFEFYDETFIWQNRDCISYQPLPKWRQRPLIFFHTLCLLANMWSKWKTWRKIRKKKLGTWKGRDNCSPFLLKEVLKEHMFYFSESLWTYSDMYREFYDVREQKYHF